MLDTGADISVVNKQNIPANQPIHKISVCLKSVSGGELHVLGRVDNMSAKINSKTITIDAVAPRDVSIFTIIGANTITKYLSIIDKSLKSCISLKSAKAIYSLVNENYEDEMLNEC